MAATGQRDPTAKRLARAAYRNLRGLHTTVDAVLPRHAQTRVFYGGALSGNVGGPLVKVQRLSEYFPNTPWRYDLVYLLSNTPYLPQYALDLLKWRNVPIVLNQNGVFYPAWFPGDWKSQNKRMQIYHQNADWVFYQSQFCKDCCAQFLGGRPGGGEVLYNAVDCNRFTPGPKRRSRFRLLHTGKIGRHMAYRVEAAINGLAAAVASGFDGELLIAGSLDAWARDAADRAVEQRGLDDRVIFRGAFTQAEAPGIYSDADAYISMTYNDACPNAVLEALACGLPVVHSNTGGVPELVGSEAGVGVDCPQSFEQVHVPDPDAIGHAMMTVVDNHARMSIAARERCVERFDIKHWINRHSEIFAQLLGNQGRQH
ncbi:MAG: glycosyltransferase family 4 protein [Pseudomonadota bacterium]